MRKNTDNRKYQEFANLVRAFARLYGDEEIKTDHVFEAQSIFEKSLQIRGMGLPLGLHRCQFGRNPIVPESHLSLTTLMNRGPAA